MSVKIGLNIQKDISKQILSDIKRLTKTDVLVGIPAEGNNREDGMNNATLGYMNETGDPERNIPARPFLVPGVEAAKGDIAKQFGKAAEAALDGRNEAVANRLGEAGQRAAQSVQNTIVNGEYAPLSERTIAARKKRGVDDDKPLIDTAKMYQSITYIVRRKGRK